MAATSKTRKIDARKPKRQARSLEGIEYHGIAGASLDCQEAIMRLLQCGAPLIRARIITSGNRHCLLLTSRFGDQIAVKSGFASGYGGTGPACFSASLQLLDSHGVVIDECEMDKALIERLDQSALTVADLENIVSAEAVQPSRCFEYITDHHQKQGRDGTLWQEFPPVVPFSIIDPRIMDLARNFWNHPDSNLSIGYRRLEDLVRARTGLTESSAKLFSRAFAGKDAVLIWMVMDESEKQGRAGLFVNVYLAYRNPRAHQENPNAALLAEFLLLNHLYLLEAEATLSGAAPKAEDSA